MRRRLLVPLLVLSLATAASASLTVFQTFVGNVGYSADGFGSVSQAGTISASVPTGATVLAAYLWSATYADATPSASVVLAGSPVTFTTSVLNTATCCSLGVSRADVTSIVAPLINGGPGGVYNFAITEGFATQDGEALVVVYSLATLPVATVGILDGFSASGGDSTSISFATPLNLADPGFFAEMSLGISFSCGDPNCGTTQSSSVTVTGNGTTITNSAGNYDDADLPPPGNATNGRLITVGGFDDPFSPLLPSYANDHERYNLVPYLVDGASTIVINTINPSNDDNIFLANFYVKGAASINPTVPEPASMLLLGSGMAGVAALRRKLRRS